MNPQIPAHYMRYVWQMLGPSLRLYLELQSRRDEAIQKWQKPTFLHCLKTTKDQKENRINYTARVGNIKLINL